MKYMSERTLYELILTMINKKGNDISEKGARKLNEALKTNSTLTSLSVDCNKYLNDHCNTYLYNICHD